MLEICLNGSQSSTLEIGNLVPLLVLSDNVNMA